MTWVSIIVPVRNESTNIRRTLEGLVCQDFPADGFEILVVDGESDDNSREIVAEFMDRYPQVFLFANPKRLASAARNVGSFIARACVE